MDGVAAAMMAASADEDASTSATTMALVAYLRMEADLSEEKAKRLRLQAQALSERFGITEEMQNLYQLDPDQLPPLNENGIPKYRGKKRGRKRKVRLRKANPNRRKRQHTAYTLFVKEIYPGIKEQIKAQNPDATSKEVISVVAKQWKELNAEDKHDWKLKALATHENESEEEEDEDENDDGGDDALGSDNPYPILAAAAASGVYHDGGEGIGEDEEEEDDEEEDEELGEEEEELVPQLRRRGRPKRS